MLYQAYEWQRTMLNGASAWAAIGSEFLENSHNPFGRGGVGRVAASALDVFAHASAPRGKPAFGIHTVTVDGQHHAVRESVALRRPFGSLLHFTHEGMRPNAPRILIVAPMSGHFATLLRGTVERLLERCEVYITDWTDAKMVPAAEGRFDLDDYIDHVIGFLDHIGPGAHLLAVCQPSVPALAATAVMGAASHPCRPATLTMMGGPIDTRCSPTVVNTMAKQRPLSWFRNNVIHTVPLAYPGSGRRVYPGFLQLASFMSMNLGNHILSHYEMFKHLVRGDEKSADATKTFYEEYRSVCDMTAEFYLQTVELVFQRHTLPRGELLHRGQPVDLGAIADTAILAIEGERDDISGLGQTRAALDLATGLPDRHKKYLMARDAGHYGIFNGSKWRGRIAPVVENWIDAHNGQQLQAVA